MGDLNIYRLRMYDNSGEKGIEVMFLNLIGMKSV